jgi:hypothetical protein
MGEGEREERDLYLMWVLNEEREREKSLPGIFYGSFR